MLEIKDKNLALNNNAKNHNDADKYAKLINSFTSKIIYNIPWK